MMAKQTDDRRMGVVKGRVQALDPHTGKWIKIDAGTVKIITDKKTVGPYKGIRRVNNDVKKVQKDVKKSLRKKQIKKIMGKYNMDKYTCYLDINIFLDYIRIRDDDTITFINDAHKYNVELVTSYFTYLEILDKEYEDYFAQREFGNKKTFDVIRKNIYNRELKKSELNEETYITGN